MSFFRSHCHSASDTFIGRLCFATRSRTFRRTSSSALRSSSMTCDSWPDARRSTRPWASGGEPELHPSHPTPHFANAASPTAETQPRSCPRSTSTTTESPTVSEVELSQVKNSLRLPLNRTSTSSWLSTLSETPHFHVFLSPRLDQSFRPDLRELLNVAPHSFTQGFDGPLGIGVCTSRRLRNHFIYQS